MQFPVHCPDLHVEILGNILTQITDHFPQFLIVKHGAITYKNLSYFQHDFSHFNVENLLKYFQSNMYAQYMNM